MYIKMENIEADQLPTSLIVGKKDDMHKYLMSLFYSLFIFAGTNIQ